MREGETRPSPPKQLCTLYVTTRIGTSDTAGWRRGDATMEPVSERPNARRAAALNTEGRIKLRASSGSQTFVGSSAKPCASDAVGPACDPFSSANVQHSPLV